MKRSCRFAVAIVVLAVVTSTMCGCGMRHRRKARHLENRVEHLESLLRSQNDPGVAFGP